MRIGNSLRVNKSKIRRRMCGWSKGIRISSCSNGRIGLIPRNLMRGHSESCASGCRSSSLGVSREKQMDMLQSGLEELG